MNKNLKTITFKDDDIELDINISLEERTAWLSLNDISVLFNKNKSTISRHIKNIIQNNYFEYDRVVAKNATTADDGKVYDVDYYNLDIILEVGNRVKSNKGILLKQFVEDYISNYYIENSNDIIIYNNGNISLDVKIAPKEDTVWLSQKDISLLYDTSQQNISFHIQNIFADGEMDDSVHKNYLYTAGDGKQYYVTFYNLDMILAIGYRVKSRRAIEFRKWATKVLKEYLLRGYVINEDRTLVTNENYINLINKVDSIDNRLSKLENESPYFPNRVIFSNGKMTDAIIVLSEIVSKAEQDIVLIDSFIDHQTLNIIKKKKPGVEVLIVTGKNKMSTWDIDTFNNDYGGLTIVINKSYHDRYLIIDEKIYFRIGGSINYLGDKFSELTKIKEEDLIDMLKNRVAKIKASLKE